MKDERPNSLLSGERVRELENKIRDGLAKYHQLLGDLEKTMRKYIKPPAKDLPRGQDD